MTWSLWRWNVTKDDWEFITQASTDMKRKVKARHVKHDANHIKFKWTTGAKPRRFRTRAK